MKPEDDFDEARRSMIDAFGPAALVTGFNPSRNHATGNIWRYF